MKILQCAVIYSIFFIVNINAGFFSSEKDPSSEIQQELININNETDLLKQISGMRSLMMKYRKKPVNSTVQNSFGNSLQKIFDKRSNDNFRQNKSLKSLLTAASHTTLLSQNQQEYVNRHMLPELKKSACFSDKGRLLSMLKDLNQNKSFHIKNRMLMNMIRHNGVKQVENDVKTLFIEVLKNTYAIRPLNDEIRLNHLKQTLEEACESTLLNDSDKKYVKNTLLPDISKNIQTVKIAPQSKVFGEMKDISTAYLKKDSNRDFDISKNNFVQGPIQVTTNS